MSRDEQLAALLEKWEEASTHGHSFTPEDLCRECPDLLNDFRQLLGQLGPIQAILQGDGIGDVPADEYLPEIDAGRYKPVSYHAKGGLGMVFLAEDSEIGRGVALKCMQQLAATDSSSRRRFLAEAEITGKLEHPGVVPVYGLGQDPHGKPYYAMRFIHGETLGDAIERFHQNTSLNESERNVEQRRLLRHFIAVCETMAYAHDRGVIHRDLKPANIMIGPYGETLVVDWGLAKQVAVRNADETATKSAATAHSGPLTEAAHNSGAQVDPTVMGHAKGTPMFMSPEQARGEWDNVGPASDVYSLGSTLFVLLSGKKPYGGRNAFEVMDHVKMGACFTPRALNAAVPKALDAVCRKAMAAHIGERYASARDLARDLERWLADEPVSAYREPFLVRTRRWLKRHRTLVTSSVAVAIVAFTALGALAVQQRRQNEALAVKNQELQTSNEKVEKNFGFARQAVREMVQQAIGNPLLRKPGLVRYQEMLLKSARDYYVNFLSTQKSDDPEVAEEMAQAHFYVAVISQETGVMAEARSEFAKSLAIMEKLPEARASTTENRVMRATILVRLGLLECDRGEATGFDRLNQGLAVLQQIGKENPDDPAFPLSEATFLTEAASRYDLAGRQDDAVAAIDRCQAIFEAIRKSTNKMSLEFKAITAGQLADLAGLMFRAGKIQKAIAFSDQSGRIIEELRGKDLDPAYFRYVDWIVGIARSEVLTGIGKYDEAIDLCERACAGLHPMLLANPELVESQVVFGRASFAAGQAYREKGLNDKAVPHFVAARDAYAALVKLNPDHREFRQQLGSNCQNLSVALRDLGKLEESNRFLKEAREHTTYLLELDPNHRLYRFNQATIEITAAVTHLKSKNDAAAMPFLEKAKEITTKLLEEDKSSSLARKIHGMVLRNLGIIQNIMSKDEESLRTLEQACEIFDKLSTENPDIPSYATDRDLSRMALANALTTSAATLWGDKKKEKTYFGYIERAQSMLEPLAKAHPLNPMFTEVHSRNLFLHCLFLREHGVEAFGNQEYAKALPYFERAFPLSRKMAAATLYDADQKTLRKNILLGMALVAKHRGDQLDPAKPAERLERKRLSQLGVDAIKEVDPEIRNAVDVAALLRVLEVRAEEGK
ncbi:MAG: protein kinase [Planctomycetes bacterium]|nr:protein kinase [Planctomycetota bacterium]